MSAYDVISEFKSSTNILDQYKFMKKKCTRTCYVLLLSEFKHLYRVMKLTFAFILLCVSTVFAFNANSQNARIHIDAENAQVRDVIKQIEEQTDYLFVYNYKKVDLSQQISLKLSDTPVSEVLRRIFENSDIIYAMEGHNIMLMKRESLPQQQKKRIRGYVEDQHGEPVIGANIVEKGTGNGTVTDVNGTFSLEVAINATLQISYIGYNEQEVKVTGKDQISVTLREDMQALDEVVVVGYGTQRKGNMTGAISNIKSGELTVSPIASTSNALAGRLPGLVAVQSSGQPGADAAALKIRGFGDALIIVDGVESDFNNIDANQIESISILKDGSASIYGARAGNGVILVTTKRGIDSKPMFSLNVSGTFQGVTKILKPLSSGQYVEIKRESHFNGGGTEENAPYTKEAMQEYYKGTNPLYPNTDWYDVLMRSWSPQQQYNLSVRGGSDKIKYYGFIGFMDQQTMIKKHGGNYRRYNLQSNIDAKINNSLSFQLDVVGIFEDQNTPARDMGVGGYMWEDYWSTLPIYHSSFPDPTKIPFAHGGGMGGLHITSNSELSGYYQGRNQKFQATGSLNYKVLQVEGLSAKFFANYVLDYKFGKNFTKPVDLYTWDPESDTYTLAGAFGDVSRLTHTVSKSHTLTLQGMVNYDRIFNEKHHLTAAGIFECIDYRTDNISAGRTNFLSTEIDYLFGGSTIGMYNDGDAYEMGRMSFVGRFNYAYDRKYLIETIIRADASAKFAKSHRWGYFPSVSLGWVMSEERFMKNMDVLDNLKLRASYGRSGNDAVGSFQYLTGYNFNKLYMYGSNIIKGLASTGLANPFLTWETMDIYNVGVDFSLFNRKLYGVAEAFYRDRKDIPAKRQSSLPSSFGAVLPEENLNSINNRGFELLFGTSGNVKDFVYDISGNISWSRAKYGHYEEPEYTDPDQIRIEKRSGQWVDRVFGYKSDGLFTSQAEIDALGFDQDGSGNKNLRPGDVRLVDTNGDKVLDWRDQVEIGKGSIPNWMFGANFNLKYKGFDLSLLFQGAFDYYSNLSLEVTRETFNERWTEENNDHHAIIPRVGSIAPTANYASDYFYKRARYIRLKTASFGYNLPKRLITAMNIEKARVYLSGTNVFTLSNLSKYGIDPEAPNIGHYYPQQRTISLGLNVTF